MTRPTPDELTHAHAVPVPDVPGLYYHPAGDFFDVFVPTAGGSLRASLLPWSAPLDGNQYPAGPSGQPGVGFTASDLPGPWYPLSLVMKGSQP